MTVGVVGLGLIGGSLCKAYKQNEGIRVLALDIDKTVEEFAQLSGAADAPLTEDNLRECDLLLIATYPAAAAEYLRCAAPKIDTHTVVIDCLGTKREICRLGFALAEEFGFTFVGGHPMAGTQYSGFKYSRANLFHGAPMVIVPPRFDDIDFLESVKALLVPAGFGSITVTTAEKHDESIAFTSQLAHVVSNAYIKSPTARNHRGVSAGSYKDLTRVAWLNPQMWAELFLENGDNLLRELDCLMESLGEYRSAIAGADRPALEKLLDVGRQLKQEIDGRGGSVSRREEAEK